MMMNRHQNNTWDSKEKDWESFSVKAVRLFCVVILSVSTIGFISGCDLNVAHTNNTASSESELANISAVNTDDNMGATNEGAINASKKTYDSTCHNDVIATAYTQQHSDVQVKGCGQVVAVLKDDNEGSRHQRFIVKLEGITPKQTILIAHNIDLAPRVSDLKKGDFVTFYGEYEYNSQGGVIHWTHHDPAARHQNGWIEKDNKHYE